MLAQTTDGFYEVLKIKDDIQLYDTLGNASCLNSHWTNQLPVFTAPVEDPYECAEDAGYVITLGQEPRTLRQVLSELMGASVETYRHFVRK